MMMKYQKDDVIVGYAVYRQFVDVRCTVEGGERLLQGVGK